MWKLLAPLAIALSLSACSASLAEMNYGPPKSGKARYLNQGLDVVIANRKTDAEAKIREFCGGPYKVVGNAEDGQLGGLVNYSEIKFVCLDVDSVTP